MMNLKKAGCIISYWVWGTLTLAPLETPLNCFYHEITR